MASISSVVMPAVMILNSSSAFSSEYSTGMSENGGGFSVFEGAASSGVGVPRSMIVLGAFPKLCIGGRCVLNAPKAAMPVADMSMVGLVFPKVVADMLMVEYVFPKGVADIIGTDAPTADMSMAESGFLNDVAVISMSDASIADMSIVEWEFRNGVADMPMAGCVFANMGAPVVVAIGNMELM